MVVSLSSKKEKIKSLYDECNIALESFVDHINDKEVQRTLSDRFSDFFFQLESCAAECYSLHDSEHHELGKWFADTAYEALELLVIYQSILKELNSTLYYSPSKTALSSMQALIQLYFDASKVRALREILLKNNITTAGFDEKRKFRMTKTTERIISIVVAIISVICMWFLIDKMDEPTPNKYNFYSVLIATFGALSAALFTGTLGIQTKNIKATCGFGTFIVIFFILQGVKIL